VKRGEGNTNSPELSLLKFLPLAYHHSHFLAAILDFTSFFTTGAAHFFYSWAVFGLDSINSSGPRTDPCRGGHHSSQGTSWKRTHLKLKYHQQPDCKTYAK